MHDYVAQSLIHLHIDDLRRDAARHQAARLASVARPRRTSARVPAVPWVVRLPGLHRARGQEPQCCPA